MTDQVKGIQRTGIHAAMDIVKNMPLPASLRKWDQTILLQIRGQDDFCYEWIIRDGQWKINEGKTCEPGIILTGKEIDFVREFSDINSSGKTFVQTLPAGNKKSLSIGDAMKYGTLRGKILYHLQGQFSQLIAEAEQRQGETIAVMQKALAVEIKPPVFQVDEIIPRSAQAERTCSNCGKTYPGVARTPPDPMPSGIATMVAVRCQNCGIEFCTDCHEKVLKIGIWNGWEKTKCPDCNELFGPGQIILRALHYVPILLSNDSVLLDPVSGVVRHHPSNQSSILDGITFNLLNDRYIGNASTFGITGNKYANDLKKLIDRNAQNIGNEFFAGLVAKGAIMNHNEMNVGYQGLVNSQATEPPVNLGKIIVLYAQDIADLQGHPVTLETMETAYQFFLTDFQRYLAGIGVKFHDAEELVDWRVMLRQDNKEQSIFLLVTNQRLVRARGKIIVSEMQILEGESRPLVIFRKDGTSDAFISALMFVYRTNKRLIWYTDKSFKSETYNFSNLDQDVVITKTAYFEKSRLLILLTDRRLLIWPEQKPLQTIPLVDITRIETTVEIIEKKMLLVSHKVEQNKIVIYCPDKQGFDIAAREQDAVIKFLPHK